MGSKRYDDYCRDEEMKYHEAEAVADANEADNTTFINAVRMVASCRKAMGDIVTDSFIKAISDASRLEDRSEDALIAFMSNWEVENF